MTKYNALIFAENHPLYTTTVAYCFRQAMVFSAMGNNVNLKFNLKKLASLRPYGSRAASPPTPTSAANTESASASRHARAYARVSAHDSSRASA